MIGIRTSDPRYIGVRSGFLLSEDSRPHIDIPFGNVNTLVPWYLETVPHKASLVIHFCVFCLPLITWHCPSKPLVKTTSTIARMELQLPVS